MPVDENTPDYVLDDDLLDADIPMQGDSVEDAYDPTAPGNNPIATVDLTTRTGSVNGLDFDWRNLVKDVGGIVGGISDVVKDAGKVGGTSGSTPPQPPPPPPKPGSGSSSSPPVIARPPAPPVVGSGSSSAPVVIGVATVGLLALAAVAYSRRRRASR